MEYSVQKIGGSRVEIAFKINDVEWNNCIQEAYKKNKQRYKLEGFRAGKVPFKLLVNRYGIEIFYEDAMDYALNYYYGEILDKEHELKTIASPEVDVKTVDEKGLSAVFTVSVMPEFELAQYKGLKFDKVTFEVTDTDVDTELEKLREKYAKWTTRTDRKVKHGDKITLDYSGTVDGVQFEGGTAENQTLDIGSGQFIPGFEDQLIGAEIGVEINVEVQFPEAYHNDDLSGKDAIFKCTVKDIREKELPSLDDDFAKDLGEFDTIEEQKVDIKTKLTERAKERARYQEDDIIVKKIVDETKFEVPDTLVDNELDRLINDFSMRMAYSGIRFDDYLKYIGSDLEKFKEEHRNEAVESVKTRLILEKIIETESIDVSNDEIESEIEKLAQNEKKTIKEVKESLKDYGMHQIINRLLGEKLFDFLRNNNTFS